MSEEIIPQEATIQEADAPKPINLGPKKFEVSINVSPNDTEKVIVSARLNRPDLSADIEFTKSSGTVSKDAGGSEEQIILSDGGASSKLFDGAVESVKGYLFDGESDDTAEKWREVDETLKEMIPHNHKHAFVRGMRLSYARYLGTVSRKGFVLGGGGTLPVELVIGTKEAPLGSARFEVPEPEETERIDFENNATQFLQGIGEKRGLTRQVTDMKLCVEFFDKLMLRRSARIEGGHVGGQAYENCSNDVSRKAFLAGIDPHYKVKVIGAALVKYAARLQD
jgi:hypothetical protein